jgi:hypothetical protein
MGADELLENQLGWVERLDLNVSFYILVAA